MDRPRGIGEKENNASDDEEKYQTQDRMPERTGRSDDDREHQLPHPGRPFFRDLVKSKERRFASGRDHLRIERTRQCLRAAENHSDEGPENVSLKARRKKAVRVDHDPAPYDER